MPVNYQNGKIYKIVCNLTNEIYIGSTCEPTLARRLAGHVTQYKNHKNGKTNYVTSFRIIERCNYNIYLIENFPCNNKDELTKREGEIIQNMKNDNIVVNKNIAGRTKAQYEKVYYEANKCSIRETHKIYRENNKQKLKDYYYDNIEKEKERRAVKCTCK